MDAIAMLNEQHDEIDELFEKAEDATISQGKEHLFLKLADALAAHATIEEELFYPAVRAKRTEDILLEALEEHLGIKRLLRDLLDLDPSEETFDAKLSVLREQVDHHVTEEKTDLFPKVRKLMTKEQLQTLGDDMATLMDELEGTEPRERVRAETDQAARLR